MLRLKLQPRLLLPQKLPPSLPLLEKLPPRLLLPRRLQPRLQVPHEQLFQLPQKRQSFQQRQPAPSAQHPSRPGPCPGHQPLYRRRQQERLVQAAGRASRHVASGLLGRQGRRLASCCPVDATGRGIMP